MHSDPEWGKEGRLDGAAQGCHAVALVWQACPSASLLWEESCVRQGWTTLVFLPHRCSRPSVTSTPVSRGLQGTFPGCHRQLRQGGRGRMASQQGRETRDLAGDQCPCDSHSPRHPGTLSASFSELSSVHQGISWAPGCCHCCENSRAPCGVGQGSRRRRWAHKVHEPQATGY